MSFILHPGRLDPSSAIGRFPLLIKTQFPTVTIALRSSDRWRLAVASLRGLLADKSVARSSRSAEFHRDGAATIGVLYFVEVRSSPASCDVPDPVRDNRSRHGSTYGLIPSIFREENCARQRPGRAAAAPPCTRQASERRALGFIGAIGACAAT